MYGELQRNGIAEKQLPQGTPDRGVFFESDRILVNDAQSQLNLTSVQHLCRPRSVDEIAGFVSLAKKTNCSISISGGRHAMGGQQFGEGNLQLDMSEFNQVLHLDAEKGLVKVQSGIVWPKLIRDLRLLQETKNTDNAPWVIREKQTGVDSVSIGGSLSANIHGRGLRSRPFVDSVDSFQLVNHKGELIRCSRNENSELFSLAIGGYGLFGVIATVTLRLVRRFKVQRHVQRIRAMDAATMLEERRDAGYVFGDCQFAIDLRGAADEHEAILPCYRPVAPDARISTNGKSFNPEDWASLYRLSRIDKRKAFELFAHHYLATDGQVYWSDTHQLSDAFCGYRVAMDPNVGTEMITEIYLDHDNAIPCLERIRETLAARNADVTYGTIRLIEADEETFLPWARRRSVCIVANLHCSRRKSLLKKTKQDFRTILDCTLAFGGSFYLTYHRWALAHHVRAAYPHIRKFFRLKKLYDPNEQFQSNWYRHYRQHFG